MARRVAITGLGFVTPLGTDVHGTWEGLVAGRSGAGPITRFDPVQSPVKFACEVKGFEPARFLDRKEIRPLRPVRAVRARRRGAGGDGRVPREQLGQGRPEACRRHRGDRDRRAPNVRGETPGPCSRKARAGFAILVPMYMRTFAAALISMR